MVLDLYVVLFFESIIELISKYKYNIFIKKGGGSGGSIREAGGKFGEREAAMENAYFRKLVCYQK